MRLIGLAVVLSLTLAPLAGEAQQAGKVARIGFLGATSPASNPHVVEAFRKGLRDIGYVEGQTAVIEFRFAEGDYQRLSSLAADLVSMGVDVIFAPATPAALAAKNATGTIPIVMATVLDPVGLGLVASLGRPGGNVTGLTTFVGPEIVGKHLELFKEAVPKLSRVAVLQNPANPTNVLLARQTRTAADSLGVQLRILDARRPAELEDAFHAMPRTRTDGLLVLPDNMLWTNRARLADLAAKNRLPTMFRDREHVEAGGLMSYGANTADLVRRGAIHVGKILKGAKPADLPVEQPTKFELVINLKTAKALGLTIPQSVLVRADEIIR